MTASGAASLTAVEYVRWRKRSGYNEILLSTGNIIRLNVQRFGAFWVATAPYDWLSTQKIVPDGAI